MLSHTANTLTRTRIERREGRDRLGEYEETVIIFTPKETVKSEREFETRFRIYQDRPFILFGQVGMPLFLDEVS